MAGTVDPGWRPVGRQDSPSDQRHPAAKRAAKQEAHRWLDAFLVEQGTQAGRHGERAALTLNQWTASWLAMFGEKVAAGLKARRTLVSYRKDLTLYVLPTLGQIRLGDLTGEHVERWLTRLAATPLRIGKRLFRGLGGHRPATPRLDPPARCVRVRPFQPRRPRR